jgi:pimeloyl-ACP methyl ester carboxylesterase
VAQPSQQLRIPTGEVALNVRISGDGPTVLLLHGFPDSGDLWRGVAPLLVTAGYRVLAPDLRGFGESDAPVGRRHYALDRVVADVVALLDQLGDARPVHVVGHDWGAVVAWCLAIEHPQRVRSSVVISVGHPWEYAHAGLEQKRKGLYTILVQFRGLAEAWMSRDNFSGMRRFAPGHPDLDACVRAMSRPGRLTAGLNWYRANLVRVLFGRWPACQVPTLGIWSSGDPYLVEGQMRQSGRRMAAAWDYARIEDAGHWLPLEQPQRIAALALDWFRKQEEST